MAKFNNEVENMLCTNCGRVLQDDFKYCPECATPIGLGEQVPNTTPMQNESISQVQLDKKPHHSEEKKNKLKKAFLLTMIVSLSLSALIGILVILFGKFDEFEAKVLVTTLAVGGFSLLGLCCSSIFEREKLKIFSFIGMVTCVLGLFYSILLIWGGIESLWDSDVNLKILLTFLIITVSMAQASVLLLIRYKNKKAHISLISTLALISLIALIVLGLIYELITFDNEMFFKFLTVIVILDVLGTVLTPILNKIGGK